MPHLPHLHHRPPLLHSSTGLVSGSHFPSPVSPSPVPLTCPGSHLSSSSIHSSGILFTCLLTCSLLTCALISAHLSPSPVCPPVPLTCPPHLPLLETVCSPAPSSPPQTSTLIPVLPAPVGAWVRLKVPAGPPHLYMRSMSISGSSWCSFIFTVSVRIMCRLNIRSWTWSRGTSRGQ